MPPELDPEVVELLTSLELASTLLLDSGEELDS